jgi:polyhydroxyalkanoate synthesis regulator phasin
MMDNQSTLKKILLAGLGIYSLTKEKAQELMHDLIKRGELSKDEGSKFVKAMMDKAEEEGAFLKKTIDERVSQAFARFKPGYDDELKNLATKIDKLTREVEKLSKK